MSVSLNPITITKLDQFRRRRRAMVLLRGVAAGVVTFLVAMLCVSIVDWLWVLPTSVRWTLSTLGYLASAAVVYGVCLRKLRHDTDRRELASRVEVAEPALREQLLSAIELGDTDRETPANGSPVFRAMVQDRVAGAISGVDIRRLLPLVLIRRWLLAALAILGLCVALWMVPGSHFRQLITRAVLPMANIDRVSRTKVEILEPTPHSLQVPEDETVAVVVRIGGALTDDVTLELHPLGGETIEQAMRPRTAAAGANAADSEFASNVSVGKSDWEYRILAGDAVTRTYQIRTSPRPLVQQVEKVYVYPEYAQLNDRVITETHGDLEALSGTQAKLTVTVNQPVSLAEIVFESIGESEPRRIPMQPLEDSANQFTVELPISDPEIYQIHLVSADTGFDNPFSPKYEIRPQPDRIPRVAFVDPPQGTLLLPPNDLIPLAVSVEDELPVARTAYEVSINAGPWQPRMLETLAEAETVTSFRWDLALWQLKAGDQVSIRAAAIDRKGQRGESASLQVVIATPDFDPDRHRIAKIKSSLLEPLHEWSRALVASGDDFIKILKSIEKDDSTELTEPQKQGFANDTKQSLQRANGLLQQVAKTLPQMPAGLDAVQVEWLGRAVDRVRFGMLDAQAQLTDNESLFAAADDAPVDDAAADDAAADDARKKFVKRRKEAAKRLREQITAAVDLAKRVDSGFEAVTSHDFNAAVMQDINGLSTHVDRLVLPDLKSSWQRLLRQHTVTVNQLMAIQQMIDENRGQVTRSSQAPLENLLPWLAKWQDSLDQRMGGEHQADELRRVTEQLAGELRQRLNGSSIDRDLPGRVVNDYNDATRRTGAVSRSIQQLRDTLGQPAGELTAAEQSGESEAVRKATERWSQQLQRLARQQSWVSQRLAAWRQLQQVRGDGDAAFPGDAALASRALQAVTQKHLESDYQDAKAAHQLMADLSEIAAAYYVLEAGHRLQQYRTDLSTLTEAERWDVLQIRGRTVHPLAWETLHKSNEWIVAELRAAQLPEPIWRPLEHMRWSAETRKTQDRMGVRRWDARNVVSALEPLSSQREQLDEVLSLLSPHLIDARQRLAKFVPTTAQLARQTAEQLRELSDATEQVAEQAARQAETAQADPTQDPSAPDVQLLARQQAEAQQQVQDLLDALVDQANSQDMMTAEGRETARDADDAVAMLTPPSEAMQQEMQQAAAAEDAQVAAENLADAADSQRQTAEALEQVAEHLERQAAQQDLQPTRQALRDAERELGIERQLDQQYEQAEKMAQAAMQDPQTLLKQLEAELRRNPDMQDALSDIAADAAQQAQNSLERAAQQEQNLQRDIERSDSDFQTEKAILAAEVKQLSEAITEVADQLAKPASDAASQSRDNQAKQQLDEARQNLQQAAQATRMVNSDTLLDDLANTAQQAAEALQQASEQLNKAQQAAAETQQQALSDDKRQQQAERTKAERNQSRVRDSRLRVARQQTNASRNEQKQANNELKKAQNDQKAAEQQLRKAEQDLKKNPDQDWAESNQRKAQQRLQQAQQNTANAQRLVEAAEQRKNRAEATEKQRNQWKTRDLKKPNPAAELATRLAQEAADTAKQMGQRAQEVAEQAGAIDPVQGDAQQLARAEQQQQDVGQEVQQVANDLARAARHEQRLGRETPAKQLAQTADAVQQAGEQELAQAENSLAQAAQAAAPPQAAEANAAESNPASGENGESPDNGEAGENGQAAEDGGAEQVAAAQQSLAAAEETLQQQSGQLDEMLTADAQAKAAAQAQAQAAEAAQAAAARAGEPQAAGSPAEASAASGAEPAAASGAEPATGSPPANAEPASGSQPSASSPSTSSPSGATPQSPPIPGRLSRGEMLARALDELDRALNAPPAGDASQAAAADQQAGSPAPPSPVAPSPTLAQAAQDRMRQMAIARSQARSQAAQAATADVPAGESSASGAGEGEPPADQFELERVDRQQDREWGQLTQKSAEDLREGRRDRVSERYRQQVEAYFRVIAEQSKPK
ncbi:hypothetical protein [Roseimaritima ulvae]|uniref:Uncharacterized protein n=1 Tax=Roseimaritima ulvae TaxID=980254 RepID=A0A5B9QM22_9BACT|nr:hypothetical protein [Roseimaritima ulvae]QEG38862.1 hypothetical protein UC8_08200 [Roseimaritima ulvae]